jgi:hypothetical protein
VRLVALVPLVCLFGEVRAQNGLLPLWRQAIPRDHLTGAVIEGV